MATISNRILGRLSGLASAILLLAAAPWLALAATPERDMRELIEHEDELRQVFGELATYRASDSRSEAFATYGSSRHAIVMYKADNGASGFGQKICHAALGRKEQNDWLDQLIEAADGDRLVAKHLANASSPRIRFRRSEYSSLPAWNGWDVGVCVVAEKNIRAHYPVLPEISAIRLTVYDVGKKLYAAGNESEALARFKSLKTDTAQYPNALLFIVAILRNTHPDIAEALRKGHVDLSKVSDPDALEAYGESYPAARYRVEERDKR